MWKLVRRGLASGALAVLSIITSGCSSETDAPVPQQSPVSEVPGTAAEHRGVDPPDPKLAEAEAAFRAMSNPDPEAWEAANDKLEQIGAPALPVLLKGLKSKSLDQRVNASSVLAAFGPVAEPVADELIAVLDDESDFVRANVATALVQMPEHVDRVVPVFAEILTGENEELRLSAAMNLALIETEKVRPFLPQLIAALDDPDSNVVLQVTQQLGRMGPAASVALPRLRALEPQADEELKAAITSAISLIDPDTAAE